MKKKFLLLCLIATSLFISCNDDDSSPSIEVDESLLPGTWNFIALNINNGRSTTSFDGNSITVDYTTEGKDFDMQLVLNDQTNPKSYTNSGDYTAIVTTNIQGQSTTQEESISDFLGSGEWRFSSPDKIVFITEGNEQELTIIQLDETTMKLEQQFNETFEDDFTGTTITTTGTLIVEVTK